MIEKHRHKWLLCLPIRAEGTFFFLSEQERNAALKHLTSERDQCFKSLEETNKELDAVKAQNGALVSQLDERHSAVTALQVSCFRMLVCNEPRSLDQARGPLQTCEN